MPRAKDMPDTAPGPLQPELLRVHKPPKAAKPAKDPIVIAALSRLMLKTYGPLYKARFGSYPHLTGRDWGQLKRLLTAYGEAVVETHLREFLAWDGDPWTQLNGWTLGVLGAKWNTLDARILHRQATTTSCPHQPRCPTPATCSRKRLADLKPDLPPSDAVL